MKLKKTIEECTTHSPKRVASGQAFCADCGVEMCWSIFDNAWITVAHWNELNGRTR